MALAEREGVLVDVPEADAALSRAVEHLLGRQDAEGFWRGVLETNVTMDAEDLMMRQFLGVRTEEQTQATARWIRRHQREDGSWAIYAGGPADPSTTTEAYIALRLAGDAPEAPHMRKAREVVLAHGGLEGTRVFTKMWLALFGLWSWDDVPALPPELVFVPSWFPLNLYDFACWARQTIGPLTMLSALRPQRDLGVGLDELRTGRRAAAGRPDLAARAFGVLDKGLHAYGRRPVKPLRTKALRAMADWVVERQEADGCWGGIQPPWVYSLMALHAYGYPLDHPVLARGLEGWERFTVLEDSEDGPVRWIEACQSPVWDTALAAVALGDAGLDPDHPAMARARDYLLREEIRVKGDWAVKRPDTPPSGWAFEFDNDLYPDTDDTAEVLMALRRCAPGSDVDAAVQRGVRWLLDMQSSNDGWAAFDVDNTREIVYKLPFCDFGAVIDPPSADVTAHIVEALAREGMADHDAVRRGVAYLLDEQEDDGSWFGRWGVNYVYGTGAAVPALVEAGVPVEPPGGRPRRGLAAPAPERGRRLGRGPALLRGRRLGGRGACTPSQTAWALLALHAAGHADGVEVARGVQWLVGAPA